jgi:hypothetical protein
LKQQPHPADIFGVTRTPTGIAAAEYTAIVKPKSERGRTQPGVVLVLQPAIEGESEQIFSFSSWRFLRESLRVFGLASAKELDNADIRLSTSRQPYMFSRRRWEIPLLETLYGNCDQP